MEKIKVLVKSEWFFVFIVSAIALFLSFYPTLYEWGSRAKLPPDRAFDLVFNWSWDFHAYISKVIQGNQGGFLVYEKFTSELHPPSLLQIFYLMLGRAGGLFSLSSIASFHLGRAVFGLLWIVSGYVFIRFCFPNRPFLRKSALVLFLFSGNFPNIISDPQSYGFMFLGGKLGTYLSGWTHFLPSDKLIFLPHWNAGHVFTVLTLFSFWQWSKKKTVSYGILAGICGLIGGFILPPTLVISMAICGFFSLCLFVDAVFKKRTIKEFLCSYATVLPFWILSFTPLVYNLWVTSFYPWKSLIDFEIGEKFKFPWIDYMFAMGLTFPLGVIGTLLAVLLKKARLLLASLWVFSTLFLIVVFDTLLVWTSQARFVQAGVELPLAILSVYFLNSFFSYFKKLKIMILTVCVIIAIPSVLTWAIGIQGHIDFTNQKMAASHPRMSMGPYVVYPAKDVMKALDFLSRQKDNKVVFSGIAFGNYAGAYTDKFTYIGHVAQTVKFNTKHSFVERFYKGEVPEEEIKQVFTENRIAYVVYGPEEREIWGDKAMLSYTFLKPVFTSKEVIVYVVKW